MNEVPYSVDDGWYVFEVFVAGFIGSAGVEESAYAEEGLTRWRQLSVRRLRLVYNRHSTLR